MNSSNAPMGPTLGYARMDDVWSSDQTNSFLWSFAYEILWEISGYEEIHSYDFLGDFVESIYTQDFVGLAASEDTVFEKLIEMASVSHEMGLSPYFPRIFRLIRQIYALFTKRADISVAGVDREAEARKKFLEAEHANAQTNVLFRKREAGGFQFPSRVESVLFRAQRKIADLLGDVPNLEDLTLTFGPGASTRVKKKNASPRAKLSATPSCSEEMIGVLPDFLAELPHLLPEGEVVQLEVAIDDSRLSFVRKTWKTDRAIAVEPHLNGMAQRGIGKYLASQLRSKWGLDLRDQSANQRLAREGSLTGGLATLDLSSASDTVSSELIAALLPYDWWDFLRKFRSGYVLVDGKRHRLEMFSSMGNGFTFPLESLIFHALARACAVEMGIHRSHSRAYGDDIIIETKAYQLLVDTLVCIGFLPNKRKSFATGFFRESCGADYVCGVSVRPFFVKDQLDYFRVFTLRNNLERISEFHLSRLLESCVPESLRLYGPDGYGDGHLVSDREGSCQPFNRDRGWAGYTFETFTRNPIKRMRVHEKDYVFPCYSIYASGEQSDRSKVEPSGIRYHSRRPEISGDYSFTDVTPGFKGYRRSRVYTFTG